MTIDWGAIRLPTGRTRYRTLVDAIATEIEAGRLRPGEQLPTHRALAASLGVSTGTVTRAYAEAEQRGLVSGEVGRGTFVRARDAAGAVAWGAWAGTGVLDLSLALPWTLPDGAEGRHLAETLADIAAGPDLTELLQYQPDTGLPRHRAAAADWLERSGVPAAAQRIVVTAGAQHAMAVAMTALLRPGDEVLCEALTYPGLIALARTLGHPLRGIEIDDEGLVPSALDRACRQTGARVLYVVPTAQNPTGATMSAGRRRAIAEVARSHGLWIVEDDVHGMQSPEPITPIAALAPDRTVHLTTFSKSVTFGLRSGFVVAPAPLVDVLMAGVRGTIWNRAPLMVEVTLRWLADGTALSIMERKRVEHGARQAMVADRLGPLARVDHRPFASHAWVHLPEPWRAEEFAEHARHRGVLVTPAATFAATRASAPDAIRLCVGTPPDRSTLARGLDIVAGLLEQGPPPAPSVV